LTFLVAAPTLTTVKRFAFRSTAVATAGDGGGRDTACVRAGEGKAGTVAELGVGNVVTVSKGPTRVNVL
jgi:hypothetical protein